MPDTMEFPFDNEAAGLSMCDPGARGKGQMSAGAYKRASAKIPLLIQLFRDYRPGAKATGATRPANTRPTGASNSG